MSARAERARFLFRTEEGVVDAPTWRFHVGWMLLVCAVMTWVWTLLRPYTVHDLAKTAFFAPMTVLAFAYLIVFAFAVLFIAVSYTMLSMKRLRDRREPTGLAGLVPLLALFAGAAHWLQPQTPDAISIWYVVALDAALVIAAIWTLVDLGFRPGRR